MSRRREQLGRAVKMVDGWLDRMVIRAPSEAVLAAAAVGFAIGAVLL